jgi:hypothetical protein
MTLKEETSMEICIHFGGQTHCFIVPVLQVPFHFPPVGPGPVNYPQFLADAILVASVQSTVQHVADAKVRQSLEAGISEALEAMQKHAGSEVTIRGVRGAKT